MTLTRELVALCHREVLRSAEEDGPIVFRDEDYERAARQVLSDLEEGPIWVFAYGSLLWRPAGQPVEQRKAIAPGWHRSFCMDMTSWRGTPEQPGLMMALRSGGSCGGIAQRFDGADRQSVMVELLDREIGGPVGFSSLRLIELTTEEGPLRALCFYADPPDVAHRPERPPEEIAAILARACGHAGSGAEYLFNTVTALSAAGIHDPHLWQLQELVAEEITKIHLGSPYRIDRPA